MILVNYIAIFAIAASPQSTPDAVAIAAISAEIAKQDQSRVVCVEVDGNDASPHIIRILNDGQRLVVQGSECKKKSRASRQKSTHRPAVFMSVDNFSPIAADQAELDLSTYYSSTSNSHERILMRLVAGRWTVVGAHALPSDLDDDAMP